MDRASFAAALAAEGYAGPLDRRMEAGQVVPEHSHPFDARLLVLEGEFILDQGGTSPKLRPGRGLRGRGRRAACRALWA
jgi:hypothetical protein